MSGGDGPQASLRDVVIVEPVGAPRELNLADDSPYGPLPVRVSIVRDR